MEALTENIRYFIEHFGALAYVLIAGIILLENAGIPLPGETTLILAGTLCGGEHPILSFPLVLIAALSGAIVGDNLGYFLGRRYGRGLILRYGGKFGLNDEKFDRAETAFLKNSSWAVFIGRFIVLLRILAGPLAGITRMPWLRFVLFNALGALAWASAITTAAFFFGKAVSGFIESIGIWGLVLLVGGILLFGMVRHYMDEQAEKRAALEARKHPSASPTALKD